MASLLHLQDTLDPCDDLVRTRIRRFVQINVPGTNVVLDGAVQRRRTERQRRVMICAHIQFVNVLQQQWPFRCVQCGQFVGSFDLYRACGLDFAQILIFWLLLNLLLLFLLAKLWIFCTNQKK